MFCEKILGNVKDRNCEGYIIDYVNIDWFDAFKRLHKKTSNLGNVIGIRLGAEVLTEGINDGSILYEDEKMLIVVNIPEAGVIKIRATEGHSHILCKVCYEIGNRHGTLLWGEDKNEVITPFNGPMLDMLSKFHGIEVEVVSSKIDFDKRISASVNNHSH